MSSKSPNCIVHGRAGSMIPNSTLFDALLTSGLHDDQCAAVGLATPNHRCQASIHVCLTPTSDYASQQQDERNDEPRLALLALQDNTAHHHRLVVAWAAPRPLAGSAVALSPRRTLQCALRCAAMRLHYAGCNAGAHRYSQSAAFSDRES